MKHPPVFYRSILDSITDHLAVIDHTGTIRYVNAAWIEFGIANACPVPEEKWLGINYLNSCDASAASGEKHARVAAAGIRKIIDEKSGVFYHEYPCHSETEQRWFMMRITPLQWDSYACFVISHQNITERKQIEEQLQALTLEDSLTAVANRRHFDNFLDMEWRRNVRTNTPLSLILLDIDQFKAYNDGYGHRAGDDCLKRIGELLKCYARRPGDLCARYGGEEFALILGNTGTDCAVGAAHKLRAALCELKMAHAYSTVCSVVTASLGVATVYPRKGLSAQTLVKLADQALYAAKKNGRNRVAVNAEQIPRQHFAGRRN